MTPQRKLAKKQFSADVVSQILRMTWQMAKRNGLQVVVRIPGGGHVVIDEIPTCVILPNVPDPST
jgi:lipoate-protein ligase A